MVKDVLLLDMHDFTSLYLTLYLGDRNVVGKHNLPEAIDELANHDGSYGAFVVDPESFYKDMGHVKGLIDAMEKKRQSGLFVCLYSIQFEESISDNFRLKKARHYDHYIKRGNACSVNTLVESLKPYL